MEREKSSALATRSGHASLYARSFAAAVPFVLLLLSLFSPLPLFAADKTIGVIMTGNIQYYRELHKALTEALPSEGVAPGSVEIILQSPTPEPMSLTNAARKLVAVGSDIIVSYGAPATMAALSETSEIPVVFAGVYDPQALGIVGRNATGVSSKVPIAALIKYLKSISNFSTLGVVLNDAEKDTVLQANEIRQLEGTLGFRSQRFSVKRADDAPKVANVDAIFLTTACAAMHCINTTAGVARKAKIPTAAAVGGGENSGVLLTISANPQEQGKETARMVAKVLKGAKPSSLPPQLPKKVDMTLNLKEATDLGLKVPFDLLTSATRLIK